MVITNPSHWKEAFHNRGPKYDKIVEIIDAINDITDYTTDLTAYFKVNGRANEDLTLNGTGRIISSDVDATHILGRCKVGYVGFTDYAGFAHRDMTTNRYALLQGPQGDTFLNTAPTKKIYFRVDNVTTVDVDVDKLTLATSKYIDSPAGDIQSNLGRAAIGGIAGDAVFANRVGFTAARAALIQNAVQDTQLNAALGRAIYFTINNTLKATLDANGLKLLAGADVTEFSTDTTLAGDSDDAVPTEKAIKTYTDKATTIGSTNQIWQPCSYRYSDAFFSTGYNFISDGTATLISFKLPLPTTKGGKALYIKGIKFGVNAADATDYIDRIRIIEVQANSAGTRNTFYDYTTNIVAPTSFSDTFTAHAASGYDWVFIFINVVTATSGHLALTEPLLDCYYA